MKLCPTLSAAQGTSKLSCIIMAILIRKYSSYSYAPSLLNIHPYSSSLLSTFHDASKTTDDNGGIVLPDVYSSEILDFPSRSPSFTPSLSPTLFPTTIPTQSTPFDKISSSQSFNIIMVIVLVLVLVVFAFIIREFYMRYPWFFPCFCRRKKYVMPLKDTENPKNKINPVKKGKLITGETVDDIDDNDTDVQSLDSSKQFSSITDKHRFFGSEFAPRVSFRRQRKIMVTDSNENSPKGSASLFKTWHAVGNQLSPTEASHILNINDVKINNLYSPAMQLLSSDCPAFEADDICCGCEEAPEKIKEESNGKNCQLYLPNKTVNLKRQQSSSRTTNGGLNLNNMNLNIDKSCLSLQRNYTDSRQTSYRHPANYNQLSDVVQESAQRTNKKPQSIDSKMLLQEAAVDSLDTTSDSCSSIFETSNHTKSLVTGGMQKELHSRSSSDSPKGNIESNYLTQSQLTELRNAGLTNRKFSDSREIKSLFNRKNSNAYVSDGDEENFGSIKIVIDHNSPCNANSNRTPRFQYPKRESSITDADKQLISGQSGIMDVTILNDGPAQGSFQERPCGGISSIRVNSINAGNALNHNISFSLPMPIEFVADNQLPSTFNSETSLASQNGEYKNEFNVSNFNARTKISPRGLEIRYSDSHFVSNTEILSTEGSSVHSLKREEVNLMQTELKCNSSNSQFKASNSVNTNTLSAFNPIYRPDSKANSILHTQITLDDEVDSSEDEEDIIVSPYRDDSVMLTFPQRTGSPENDSDSSFTEESRCISKTKCDFTSNLLAFDEAINKSGEINCVSQVVDSATMPKQTFAASILSNNSQNPLSSRNRNQNKRDPNVKQSFMKSILVSEVKSPLSPPPESTKAFATGYFPKVTRKEAPRSKSGKELTFDISATGLSSNNVVISMNTPIKPLSNTSFISEAACNDGEIFGSIECDKNTLSEISESHRELSPKHRKTNARENSHKTQSSTRSILVKSSSTSRNNVEDISGRKANITKYLSDVSSGNITIEKRKRPKVEDYCEYEREHQSSKSLQFSSASFTSMNSPKRPLMKASNSQIAQVHEEQLVASNMSTKYISRTMSPTIVHRSISPDLGSTENFNSSRETYRQSFNSPKTSRRNVYSQLDDKSQKNLRSVSVKEKEFVVDHRSDQKDVAVVSAYKSVTQWRVSKDSSRQMTSSNRFLSRSRSNRKNANSNSDSSNAILISKELGNPPINQISNSYDSSHISINLSHEKSILKNTSKSSWFQSGDPIVSKSSKPTYLISKPDALAPIGSSVVFQEEDETSSIVEDASHHAAKAKPIEGVEEIFSSNRFSSNKLPVWENEDDLVREPSLKLRRSAISLRTAQQRTSSRR